MKRTALDKWICETEGIPRLTRPALEALQLRRLNALLARERARGGFYRDMPERLGSLAELERLPFTTAEDLSANAAGLLLTSQAEVERIISGATSGTTGPVKRVFYTRRDLEHTVGFFAAGISEFTGPGDAVLVAMPFSGPDGLGELICRAVESLGARSVRAGVGRSLGELDALLDAERPSAYIGMSVPLLGLLRWRRLGGRETYIRRALVSGDACPEGVCAEIERILGTRLFPHYGSREMCLGGAVTCAAHEGMHLRENHVLAEIIGGDGRPLPEGERGELVITTLDMEAMPLIRYRTGDIAVMQKSVCGSHLAVLGHIRRRKEGATEYNGHYIYPALFDEVLFSTDGLLDYRIFLDNGRISLDVECLDEGAFDTGTLKARIMALPFMAGAPEIEVRLLPCGALREVCYEKKRILAREA